MSRKILIFVTLCAFLLSGFTLKQDDELKKAIDQAQAALQKAKTAKERADIARGLLAKYPEFKYTADALQIVVAYEFDEKGDLDGAIAFVKEIYSKLKDPQIKVNTRNVLLDLYGNPGKSRELEALAEKITKHEDVKFTDHLTVIRAGVKAEHWDLVLKHAEAGKPFATPEAYRKQYPDSNLSEKRIQESGKHRKGLLGAYKGWALANKNMHKEAIAAFETAKKSTRFTYLGAPDSDLYLYWGKTLMMAGDHEGAMKKLAPTALFGANKDAMKAMEKAYSSHPGNGGDYDAFVHKLRAEYAPTMSDFTGINYDDKKQTYESLKGKVTLVAFWFPT